MKAIKHKHSARNRNVITSIGSTNKKKALHSVSIQQLKGEQPTLWLDAQIVRTTPSTAQDVFPARVGTPPGSSGALRPVWTDRGLLFGGSQSSFKAADGSDTAGYNAITIVVVSKQDLPLTDGTLIDTYNPYWYAGNAALQSAAATGEMYYGLGNGGGPVDGLLGITGPGPNGKKLSSACRYDRTLAGDAMIYSKNGFQGEITTNIASTYNPTFNSNALFVGSRGAVSVFFQGLIKMIFILPHNLTQQEVDGFSRMCFWGSN